MRLSNWLGFLAGIVRGRRKPTPADLAETHWGFVAAVIVVGGILILAMRIAGW